MIKLIIKICIFILISILAFSCAHDKTEYYSTDIYAMDTFVNVVCETNNNADIKSLCENELERIEMVFSKTIDSSELSKVNVSDKCTVSKECADIIDKSISIAINTNGAFNPAMGKIIKLWDITGKKYIPAEQEISRALPYCSYKDITVSYNTITKKFSDIHLDLGACVKGYAAESVIKILRKHSINNAMISIGGNIAVSGHAPGRTGTWRVGIKNPFSPDEIACYLDCTDAVISVSGDYERYFEKDGIIYHHIFDSNTGKPSDTDIKSVAVIANDGLLSDALSTALFCMGSKNAISFYQKNTYDFEAVIFTDDEKIIITDGLKDSLVILRENLIK